MDDEERQQWATRNEEYRERADVAACALFTMRSKLTDASRQWGQTANGFPVAQSLSILAADCDRAWHAAIAARGDEQNAADDRDEKPRDVGEAAAITSDRAIAIMAWLLASNKPAMRISDRPNTAAIGTAVNDLAKTAFGDDVRGFAAFNKRVAQALKTLDAESVPEQAQKLNFRI